MNKTMVRLQMELKPTIVKCAVLAALSICPQIAQAHGDGEHIDPAKKTKVVKLDKIEKKYKKMLIGEKNIASAMSVISHKQIKQSSSSASIYSILKATPSVNEYQENLGPSVPVLTVRGVRLTALSQTLDGIPIQSLMYGGNGVEDSYNIGSIVSMGQISGIHVYPGVAPPNRSGFATIGGTISYQSKQPSAHKYANIFTKIGSYSTEQFGAQINSGKIPHSDGLELLARYSNTQTAGYIQNTPQRFSDFLFSAKKPYDYGLSKVFATIIYNTGDGYAKLKNGGYALPLSREYGYLYNVPLSQTSTHESNKFLTAILGDRTYINRRLVVSGRVFYIHKSGEREEQVDPSVIGLNYPYQNSFLIPINYIGPIGGPSAPNYDFSYNPVSVFGSYKTGLSAGINNYSSSTIGFAPKVNLFLDHNDITFGGLIAEETGRSSAYAYGTLTNMPQIDGYNAYDYGSVERRTVYSGYVQDKVSLLHNSLHIEPGVTITGASSSNYIPHNIYDSPNHPYTLGNYDKVILPYLGISYDVTKHIIGYASYGKGARFAPLEDYTSGENGSTTVAPGAETVNMYEAGLRYVSKRLYLNFDGYLQNEHSDFSEVTLPELDLTYYNNSGLVQTKGLEFSGKYYINKNLLISGNVSFNQSNYQDSYFAAETPSGGFFGYVTAGDPMSDIPNWLSNLSLDYQKGNFNGSLTGSYTGIMSGTYNTYLPAALADTGYYPTDPYWPTPDPALRFGDYFLLNLAASYKIPIHSSYLKWVKVSLNIDNLLDRHYYVHLALPNKYYDYTMTLPPQYYEAGISGMPRFIEVGLEGHFI